MERDVYSEKARPEHVRVTDFVYKGSSLHHIQYREKQMPALACRICRMAHRLREYQITQGTPNKMLVKRFDI